MRLAEAPSLVRALIGAVALVAVPWLAILILDTAVTYRPLDVEWTVGLVLFGGLLFGVLRVTRAVADADLRPYIDIVTKYALGAYLLVVLTTLVFYDPAQPSIASDEVIYLKTWQVLSVLIGFAALAYAAAQMRLLWKRRTPQPSRVFTPAQSQPVRERRDYPRLKRYAIPAIVAMLFAYFIWPTPWKEYPYGRTTVRVHRITGETQALFADGWRSARR